MKEEIKKLDKKFYKKIEEEKKLFGLLFPIGEKQGKRFLISSRKDQP